MATWASCGWASVWVPGIAVKTWWAFAGVHGNKLRWCARTSNFAQPISVLQAKQLYWSLVDTVTLGRVAECRWGLHVALLGFTRQHGRWWALTLVILVTLTNLTAWAWAWRYVERCFSLFILFVQNKKLLSRQIPQDLSQWRFFWQPWAASGYFHNRTSQILCWLQWMRNSAECMWVCRLSSELDLSWVCDLPLRLYGFPWTCLPAEIYYVMIRLWPEILNGLYVSVYITST